MTRKQFVSEELKDIKEAFWNTLEDSWIVHIWEFFLMYIEVSYNHMNLVGKILVVPILAGIFIVIGVSISTFCIILGGFDLFIAGVIWSACIIFQLFFLKYKKDNHESDKQL